MSASGGVPPSTPQPGWYPVEGESDLYRYFDGQAWTPHLHRVGAAGSKGHGANDPTESGGHRTAGSTPAAGWYPDPQADERLRYWDGSRWTEATDRAERPRRRKGWLVALAIVAGLMIVGAVVLQTLLQRGAPTSEAAAQQLEEALESQDWSSAARLLPPDEVDWVRGSLEEVLGKLELDEADRDADIDLDVAFGAPEALAEGMEVVPIRSVTVDIPREGALGASGMATDGPETEDFRDEPTAMVMVVERSGRWYVSPAGTLLEIASRENREPNRGSSNPRPRSGGADPEQAVERAAQALAAERFDEVRDLVDPEELQVLDHYGHVLGSEARSDGMRVDLQTRVEGSEVVLERVETSQEDFDLRDWCVHDGTSTECAVDELGGNPPEAVLRHLLVDRSPQVRIGTVERDGRHYLSLARTHDLSIAPLLAALDGHALAALFSVPAASPQMPNDPIAVGESTTLQLTDGWNAVTVGAVEGHPRLLACSGSSGQPLDEQRVDGYDVRTRRWANAAGSSTWLVYLEGAPVGTSAVVEVRFVDGADEPFAEDAGDVGHAGC